MKMSLATILECLIRTNKGPQLAEAVDAAMDRQAMQSGVKDKWRFIEQEYGKGFRERVKRALKPLHLEGETVDPTSLASIIRRLGIHLDDLLETNPLLDPWCRIRPPFVVACAVGERRVHTEMSKQVVQRAIGIRDAQAFASLTAFFEQHPRIECHVELHTVGPEAGEAFLERMEKRADVKVVLAIGSDAVNPATGVIAKHILDGAENLPARFRWPPGIKGGYLSEPCSEEHEQGIIRSRSGLLPRISDDEISRQAKSRKEQSYADCGMLLVDQRKAGEVDRKVLIVAAGHGGCGTWAAALQLQQEDVVHQWLQERDWLGVDRFWKLLSVDRRRPKNRRTRAHQVSSHGPEQVDDLEFDKSDGWHIVEF